MFWLSIFHASLPNANAACLLALMSSILNTCVSASTAPKRTMTIRMLRSYASKPTADAAHAFSFPSGMRRSCTSGSTAPARASKVRFERVQASMHNVRAAQFCTIRSPVRKMSSRGDIAPARNIKIWFSWFASARRPSAVTTQHAFASFLNICTIDSTTPAHPIAVWLASLPFARKPRENAAESLLDASPLLRSWTRGSSAPRRIIVSWWS
mmetsp:Transcript_38889/g.73002  ORF Transcript_38889/g.73002 Transcript_38889/m.73002 type:complete len:211 (-) Transcript_38889:845-1477(-)